MSFAFAVLHPRADSERDLRCCVVFDKMENGQAVATQQGASRPSAGIHSHACSVSLTARVLFQFAQMSSARLAPFLCSARLPRPSRAARLRWCLPANPANPRPSLALLMSGLAVLRRQDATLVPNVAFQRKYGLLFEQCTWIRSPWAPLVTHALLHVFADRPSLYW